ncbi:MAG TPA: P-loop NTPase, partial [Nitrososphaeraceae archaeon]
PQEVAMNVAVKAIGMFNKLNVPIVGVIENMSYLQCPHCNEHIHIFGKGGGQRVSEQFNIPFIGEIPLHPHIMEGSDRGKPIITAEPDSMQSLAFSKVAKTVAGRISVIAAEMNAQEENETKSDQIQPHNASHA